MSSQSSHARPAHMHPVILIDEPAFLGSVPPQAGDLWLSRAEVWKMGKVYPLQEAILLSSFYFLIQKNSVNRRVLLRRKL